MRDEAADPLQEMRRANRDATVALALEAAKAGVRRLVYLSSVKVNGESTSPGRPFRIEDEPNPHDAYAVSKREAEDELRGLASSTGLEIVIIRPVLVYGPGVKGNFRSMLSALLRGLPLPLSAVNNRRSLVGLENLADFIRTAADHPAAAGKSFLVSDGCDLSTPALIRLAGAALGVRPRLFPVPPFVLRAAGSLTGRSAAIRRLTESLQVDIGPAREILGWSPPANIDAELSRTARAFLAESRGPDHRH